MLRSLHLKDVGPAPELKFDFAPRLNLLTGDNGLGKTLLLDAAWYAMTLTWAGEPARPNDGAELAPGTAGAAGFLTARLDYVLSLPGEPGRSYRQAFNAHEQGWVLERGKSGASQASRFVESPVPGDGILLYSQADGGYAVWDAYRNAGRLPPPPVGSPPLPNYIFSRGEVWDGLMVDGRRICNGLILDWVSWQQTNNGTWRHLASVLDELTGEGGETLKPGKKTKRVKIDDSRDIPTLDLPYGNIPITLASAGMRRICALAYIIVWTWHEHRRAAELRHLPPVRDITVLVDEVEAHLHPQWQRRILPALLRVLEALLPDARVQVIAATHAPLVLASMEPHFDVKRDALFTFDLTKPGGPRFTEVERTAWRRIGDANAWLTSEIFDLRAARSVEAEEALRDAIAALRDPSTTTAEQVRAVDERLRAVLGDTEPFWARWAALVDTKAEVE